MLSTDKLSTSALCTIQSAPCTPLASSPSAKSAINAGERNDANVVSTALEGSLNRNSAVKDTFKIKIPDCNLAVDSLRPQDESTTVTLTTCTGSAGPSVPSSKAAVSDRIKGSLTGPARRTAGGIKASRRAAGTRSETCNPMDPTTSAS